MRAEASPVTSEPRKQVIYLLCVFLWSCQCSSCPTFGYLHATAHKNYTQVIDVGIFNKPDKNDMSARIPGFNSEPRNHIIYFVCLFLWSCSSPRCFTIYTPIPLARHRIITYHHGSFSFLTLQHRLYRLAFIPIDELVYELILVSLLFISFPAPVCKISS